MHSTGSLSRIYHEIYHTSPCCAHPTLARSRLTRPTLAWPTLVWPTFRSVHASLGPRFARVMRCTHGQHMHVGCTPRLVNWASPHISMHRRHLRADNYMQAPLAGGHNAGATCGRTIVPCPEWQGPTLGVVLKSTGYWGCWRIEHRCSGGYQSSTCATVPTIPLACKADTASAGKKQGVTGTGARGIPGMPNISARVSGLLFSSHPIELFFDSAFKLPEVRGKQCTGE